MYVPYSYSLPPSFRPGTVCFEERIESCCTSLRNELCHLNSSIQQHIQDLIHSAVNNLAADIRYQFLESHGPRRKEVTPNQPLFRRWVQVHAREFVHLNSSVNNDNDIYSDKY